MKSIPVIVFTAAAVTASALTLASLASATTESAHQTATPPSSDTKSLERGRYLVTHASMCVDCHSPRDEKGEFIEGQHLTGAPLGFAPKAPMPWAPAAPRIAGLPVGFTKDDTVRFLETGERPGSRPPPLPPMPMYRFNHDDAAAIATYLESLGAASR